MDSTGEILRRARNERHLTLDEVATRTRINRKYLAAIESGDSSAIPGGFFYKSFVRQYAAALSTDDDNVLEQVEQSLAAEQPVASPPPDEDVLKALATKAEENGATTTSARSAATYAVLLVLAIAGATGVYVLWHRAQQAQAAGEVSRSMPQAPKKEEVHPSPQPVPPQPSQPQPQAQPQAPEPVPPPVAQPEQTAPTPTQIAPTTNTEAPAQPPVPVPAPDSGVSANPEEKIAINVSVKEQTWFSVSADGKTLFSGTLEAGQSKTFAARENARMRIGNAAGLDVVFNGSPTGPLGPSRQPVTLLFTPSSFEIAKPKPPDPPQPPPD